MASNETTTTAIQGPQSNLTLIKDMKRYSKGFDCEVIVLQQDGEPLQKREGTIYRFTVADRTAAITLSVWEEVGQFVKSGDILRLSGVQINARNGFLYISYSRNCKMKRIGQDTFPFVEKPNISETEFISTPNTSNTWNNNNNSNSNNQWDQQQQQQQNQSINRNTIPRQQQQTDVNKHNNKRGYPGHPYNNDRNVRGRGGGGFNRGGGNNRGSSSRYHQDLDNPI